MKSISLVSLQLDDFLPLAEEATTTNAPSLSQFVSNGCQWRVSLPSTGMVMLTKRLWHPATGQLGVVLIVGNPGRWIRTRTILPHVTCWPLWGSLAIDLPKCQKPWGRGAKRELLGRGGEERESLWPTVGAKILRFVGFVGWVFRGFGSFGGFRGFGEGGGRFRVFLGEGLGRF